MADCCEAWPASVGSSPAKCRLRCAGRPCSPEVRPSSSLPSTSVTASMAANRVAAYAHWQLLPLATGMPLPFLTRLPRLPIGVGEAQRLPVATSKRVSSLCGKSENGARNCAILPVADVGRVGRATSVMCTAPRSWLVSSAPFAHPGVQLHHWQQKQPADINHSTNKYARLMDAAPTAGHVATVPLCKLLADKPHTACPCTSRRRTIAQPGAVQAPRLERPGQRHPLRRVVGLHHGERRSSAQGKDR